MIAVWGSCDGAEDDASQARKVNHQKSWTTFQNLLQILVTIATAHSVSLTCVAMRWVLQQPSVGAIILGTRLGVSDNTEDILHVFGWELSNAELAVIDAVFQASNGCGKTAAEWLYQMLGDCGSEYR
jgi:aryl-alcohol dehydrogenase-like predicted oxidoreductase